jgi:uncharacterized membrane protein YukC
MTDLMALAWLAIGLAVAAVLLLVVSLYLLMKGD